MEDNMKDKLQKLLDIEEIKKLKYRYFRGIDTADIDLLRTLFADDAELDYRGAVYRWEVTGKENIVQQIENSFTSDAVACHQGHHPEIDILSQNNAEGLWYLSDMFTDTKRKIITRGSAIYKDIYEKIDETWYIKKSEYDRIWEQYEPLSPDTNITYAYLSSHGKKLTDDKKNESNSFLDEMNNKINKN